MVAIGIADGATGREGEPLLMKVAQQPKPKPTPTSYQDARAAGTHEGLRSNPQPQSSLVISIAQLMLVVSMAVYSVVYVAFPSSLVQLVYMDKIASWWTELAASGPDGQAKARLDGRPIFLILFGVVPFAVGTVALEIMRGPQSLHRIVSTQVLRIGMVLRRKPSPFGRLQWLQDFSFGELLFLSLFGGGNLLLVVVGWIYLRNYYPAAGDPYTVYTTLEILGVVLGYSCVYNMAFVFLPATRNSAFMEFMGISYANGMKFHRWLGIATLVTAVGHGLPFYPIWYRNGVLWEKAMPCFDCSLDYFSKGYPAWFNVFGEISLVFMLILAATSLPWIRRNMYETFYFAHYTFVPAVIFAVLHWGMVVWWLLPSFTIYLVDRVLGSTHALAPVVIDECSVLCDDILKVVVSRSSKRAGEFEVGQFVYLNVPAISAWQWHAFTIGSSPRASATTFTIWLKSLGNWTDDLVKYTRECDQNGEQPVVYVDGYYGASLSSYDQYATLCLIGGGIGVTPIFAILQDIVCRVAPGNATDTIVPRWSSTRRIHFVFTFREMSLLEEIHPVLETLQSCEQTRELFTFEFYLSRAPSEEKLDRRLAQVRRPSPFHMQSLTKSSGSGALHRKACPFAEPLRGRTYRAVLYATVLVASSAAILYLDFNGGVLMAHGAKTQYWPLQNLADCMVMFAIAPVAYLFVLAEKLMTRLSSTEESLAREDAESRQCDQKSSELEWATSSNMVTYRDLLAAYNVAVGQRPDMDRVMVKVHGGLIVSRPSGADGLARTVGVFISGPEALKRATERAVAAIDSSCFDIHDEEFEL